MKENEIIDGTRDTHYLTCVITSKYRRLRIRFTNNRKQGELPSASWEAYHYIHLFKVSYTWYLLGIVGKEDAG
jgi:hypothetical protein